jgi:hypothetical protein
VNNKRREIKRKIKRREGRYERDKKREIMNMNNKSKNYTQ